MTETDTDDVIDTDAIVVHEATGRRRFIRAGAALAATGAAALATGGALAADCDRSEAGCGCSDSDTGENSDPTGAGKRCASISISSRAVEVTKVRG